MNGFPHGKLKKNACVLKTQRKPEEQGSVGGSIHRFLSVAQKPPYSPPYIHKTANGQRVSFQVWTWEDDRYKLIQYIIDDGEVLHASKFECEYRATPRAEITDLLLSCGCREVNWLFPEETGFYQPIVVARK